MTAVHLYGYLHVHIGLFANTINFGPQYDSVNIGESLIQFIYSDIAGLRKRGSCSEEDFHSIHPYFACCDPRWRGEFIRSVNEHKVDSSFYSIEDLLKLQKKYRDLLISMYSSSSENDAARSLTCYSLCNFGSSSDGRICLDYFVSSFEEVLFLELTEMLRRNVRAVECKNCGRLFIPRRINSEYCHRVYTSDGKTCAEIGYTQTFNRNVKNDELLMAYTKAYKAHYARMTKPRKRVKNMTREEFGAWYKEAKEKLNQARAGLLDAEEYKAWLKI